MQRIVSWSLSHRFLVLFGAALVAAVGVHSLLKLPIDAVPDITPNQVLVLTRSPALTPLEVEQMLTFPVETAMSGLPGIEKIQSLSKAGLSYVALYFKEDMDPYFCRRLVMERLSTAQAAIGPNQPAPEMGPITTGLGEIYMFRVEGPGRSLMELRTLLDWDIAPRLRATPGIVEVNSHGGELKTYEVQVDNDKLAAYHTPLGRVIEALERNNANAGGAYLERVEQQALVRGEALITSLADIENIVVGHSPAGTPILVRHVARVRFAPMVRQGLASANGKGETVIGVAMMLVGENSRVVVERVKQRLAEIQRTLPPGVRIVPFYDRTDLVRRTIHTASWNLIEGGLLVVAVLLLLLGSWRGGLLVALAIPLSMLAAFTGMLKAGVSGNLMSLGAIDFGLIVDGSVVMMDNLLRHLSRRQAGESALEVARDAASEMARPVFFGVAIIFLVYVPILALSGVEGKMFTPMALTVLFAVGASLVVALTVMPTLGWLAFRRRAAEKAPWLMRHIEAAYTPLLGRAMRFPVATIIIAAVVFVSSLGVAPFLGAEFLPRLDEGAVLVMMYRVPGISLAEALHGNQIVERTLKQFPEVDQVVCRTGRPEVAVDPMAIDQSDVFVMLKPPGEWRTGRTKEQLVEAMHNALAQEAPGAAYGFLQPIEMRMRELMESGVRSDVGIKLSGDDMEVLNAEARRIARVVEKIRGASDVRVERTAGLPYLRVRVRREAIARHGLDARAVLDTIESIGGKVVGQVVEANRRFALQVRFDEGQRATPEAVRALKVGDDDGHFVPIGQLADVWEEDGPAQISRENGRRRVSIEVNVRGRDLAGFVAEARRAIAREVALPAGYALDWGGQFEQLESASLRLALTVPLALLLILVLLYLNFHALRPAALIFLNVPLAATGGIFALAVRGLPFSISAGVGFIALFGIAVLNGIVLLSAVERLRESGLDAEQAVGQGTLSRLRPVVTTALVASLGFLPMALARGAGAELQRPLATVVIGGLITSTLLTLLVLPALYVWLERRRARA
jgi:cobalt-zinc-cadmium resistance protein CzcA